MMKERSQDNKDAVLELLTSGKGIPEGHRRIADRFDFRSLPLHSCKTLSKKNFNRLDFSNGLLQKLWIEHCTFEDVVFDRANLSELLDHCNNFKSCSFHEADFRSAMIGYGGSRYENCVFEKARFSGTAFIRPEFNSCKFLKCKLKGVNFNASSFVDCVFQGKLEKVCFKSGFAESNQVLALGEPRKNKMTGVDFSKADLCNVSFSHDCDLSSIAMPTDNSHLLYDNWKERLERATKLINAWPENDRSRGLLFIESHSVQDDRQYWRVLNKNQIVKKFAPLGEKILSGLGKVLEREIDET